jgi:hypothetical protein
MPVSGEYEIQVVSGMDEIFLKFGNFKFGKIVGQKIDDLNANGIRDEGEPGLQGWTIWLAREDIGPIAFTVTNETGWYEFTGLVPGEYQVYEVLQPGWISTNGVTHEVTVCGDSRIVVDFLNARLGCIFGSKYEDVNANGVFDEGIDVPIEGWKITLEITTGIIHTPEGDISAIAIVAVIYTDENGQFEFCDLEPGLYLVVEEVRDDWVNTTPTVQTLELTGPDVVLPPFLNAELGEICILKYEDLNSNGIRDQGEPGVEGWPMELETPDDELLDIGYTNADGVVCFDDLMPGEYEVSEMDIEGWTHTTDDDVAVTLMSGDVVSVSFGNFRNVSLVIFKYEDMNGNGVYDNDDEPISGWQFVVSGPAFEVPLVLTTDEDGLIMVWIDMAGEYVITEESPAGWVHTSPESGMVTLDIESGDQLSPIEFGNMQLGQIIITKFADQDLDLQFDGDEVGVAGFVFWVNGTLVGGGYLNFTVITGADGTATLSGLPAGFYVVTEKLSLSPPGWTPTTPTVRVVFIGSGSVESLDFGNAILGEITGEKFYDKNLNGVLDDGEPGLPGWTIILSGTTDGGDAVSRTTITDEDGMYEFDEVVPGIYEIDEVLMAGWKSTTVLPVVIDLSGAAEIDEVVNIGNIRLALIYGHKFLDRYGNGPFGGPNGVFDQDESGLGNWEITLQGMTATGQQVDLSVLTDNVGDIGFYEFANLLPGKYWLNETLLYGYMATTSISHLLIIPSQLFGPFVFVIDFGNTIPAPDPEVQFQLHKGWNLWSTPISVHGLTAKGLLNAIGPSAQVVSLLDSSTGRYKTYVSVFSDAYNFGIDVGQGYYIYATNSVVFSLKGDIVSSSLDLNVGWNIVGYGKMEETTASAMLSSINGGVVIIYLDPATGAYYAYNPAFPDRYDFAVSPGRAYFVWTDAAGVLSF